MSTRITLAAAASLAVAAMIAVADARAQTIYFGGEGGWTLLEDQTSKAPGLAPARSRFDSGFAAGARVGYEWGPWRFEEEYTYRKNDLTGISVGANNATGVRGSRSSHAFMTNVLYDINLGWLNPAWPVTPHIGAGIGAVNIIDRARINGIGRLFHDDDWQFGYQ